jgi:hypothetical protein
VTEIDNFQKLTHLNQFSRQKHTHARVWVILPQLPDYHAQIPDVGYQRVLNILPHLTNFEAETIAATMENNIHHNG